MKKENQIVGNEVSVKEQNQIILYQPNDTIKLEVRLEDETVWLTANQMSVLFNRDEKTIRKHINNGFMRMKFLKLTTRIFCVLMVLNNMLLFIH